MTPTTDRGTRTNVPTWARRLSATGAIALTVVAGAATAARAAAFSGGFAAAPVGAGASGYFSLRLAPRARATRTVQIANLSAMQQTLVLRAVQGVTSPSSGDVYVGKPGTCAAAGCWITGLPERLTLPAHGARDVAFSVQVPAATPSGQYLGGVAVEPASTPAPTSSGGARSAIVHEVVVGVAVTVGSHYRSALSIPAVTGAAIGDAAGIAVSEANRGAQFEHPSGVARLTAGGAISSFPVRSGTLLPGGQATLRVLTPRIAPGAHPARVTLSYDSGAKRAYWSGTVRIPAVHPVVAVVAGPNPPTPAVPQRSSGSSALLVVGLGVGGALLAAIAASLYRRRTHRAAPE